MKRSVNFFLKYLPLCILAFFSGCSFHIDVEYQIRNESGESITITVEDQFAKVDTSIIAYGTTLIFFDETHGARNASEYLDNLNAIGFKILIRNESGEVYNKDPMDISNWQKIYPERKDGLGRVKLIVKEGDFD